MRATFEAHAEIIAAMRRRDRIAYAYLMSRTWTMRCAFSSRASSMTASRANRTRRASATPIPDPGGHVPRKREKHIENRTLDFIESR